MSDADVVYEEDEPEDPFDADLQQGVAGVYEEQQDGQIALEQERDRVFTVSREMVQIIGYDVEEVAILTELAHNIIKTFSKPDRAGF